METNSRLANEVISMVTNEKSPIDEIIYQLRDIQYDLEMYDPDYDGYSTIHEALQKLQVAIQFLGELKKN